MADSARPADRRPAVHPADEELLPASAPCPFCEGRETELINPFGGQLSVAQYWCRRCRTGFEYLKWDDHADES